MLDDGAPAGFTFGQEPADRPRQVESRSVDFNGMEIESHGPSVLRTEGPCNLAITGRCTEAELTPARGLIDDVGGASEGQARSVEQQRLRPLAFVECLRQQDQ